MRIDSHTPTHFLGSALLFQVYVLIMPAWMAIILAILSGIIWEALDELNKRGYLNFKWLDPAGFDWGDIIANNAGLVLGMILYKLLTL